MSVLLVNASAREIPLPNDSVHLICTSPPYFNLRAYEGGQFQVWGGQPDCVHDWQTFPRKLMQGGRGEASAKQVTNTGSQIAAHQVQARCFKCGAWYGPFGQEPTVEQYVANLTEICREFKRVLHPSGVFWLNLGESMNGSGGAGGDYNKGGLKDGQPRYPGHRQSNLKPKDMCLVPQRVALALQDDGWWVRSFIPWQKFAPMPSSATDVCNSSHEFWIMLTKREHYYFDMEAVRVGVADPERTNYTCGMKLDASRNDHDLHERSKDWQPNPNGRHWRTIDVWRAGLDGMIADTRSYLTYLQELRNEDAFFVDETGNPFGMQFGPYGYTGKHYAVFNPDMIVPLVKSSTSEYGVCPECLSPWRRVVEKKQSERIHGNLRKRADAPGAEVSPTSVFRTGAVNIRTTIGWEPTCTCAREAVIPARVADFFVGSGTTLQVARALGRDGIGTDISLPYLTREARERLMLNALEEWENGIPGKESDLSDLPMFAGFGSA